MNVLIPMEVSQVSINAFEYALKRFPDADFTILHCITGLLYAQPPYMDIPGVTQEMDRREVLEMRILDQLQVKAIPDHINIEIYYGEPVNVVTNYINDNSFDAIVIGARDNYNLFDKVVGTTSLGIVKRTKVPVYVIPHCSTYKKYEKIVVATDEHIAKAELINAIKQKNESNAQVKFLHVKDNNESEYKNAKKELVTQLYEEAQPSFVYELEEIEGRDVADSLLRNVYDFDADLLITVARNKSFLHSLIFKSISKDLIMNASIPMLFFHA